MGTEKRKQYVYHIKQPDMVGQVLYPLNRLRDVYPDAFTRHVKKYEGREWLLSISIPPLNCLWNDVLHFSLMHPNVPYKALSLAGFTHHQKPRDWYRVPLEDVIGKPAVIYLNTRVLSDTRQLLPSDFEPVTASRAEELSGMPESNLEYYRSAFKAGEQPLVYKRAPHFFLKAELDVSSYGVLNWQDEP